MCYSYGCIVKMSRAEAGGGQQQQKSFVYNFEPQDMKYISVTQNKERSRRK